MARAVRVLRGVRCEAVAAMSERRPIITYPTEPSDVLREETTPFRCGYCRQMVMDGLGRWAVPEPWIGPGQFVAVHLVECRTTHQPKRKWWQR